MYLSVAGLPRYQRPRKPWHGMPRILFASAATHCASPPAFTPLGKAAEDLVAELLLKP